MEPQDLSVCLPKSSKLYRCNLVSYNRKNIQANLAQPEPSMRQNIALLASTVLLALVPPASSIPNNTSTEERRGWVSEPHERGTATLLYSCLFTMFICTWNALHLNMVADNGSLGAAILRKLSGVVLGLLAPEAIAMLAIKESLDARQLRRTIQPRSTSPYTGTHAMFTLMGGFAVQLSDGERFTLRPGLLGDGGIEFPDISEKDIQDKSKADWVTKSLACLQIGWFVAQAIERGAERLPLTTLEVFTITIIVCTVATYTAWWHKPFDVQRQINIKVDMDHRSWLEQVRLLRYEEEPVSNLLDVWHLGNVFLNILSRRQTPSLVLFHLAYISITLAFGGCHLIAWNFDFPTAVEQLMWRITSVACMVLPLLILAVFYIMRWYLGNLIADGSTLNLDADGVYDLFKPLYIFITGLYLLARLYLLIEVFLSLRSVPAGVYQKGGWSQYIPHF